MENYLQASYEAVIANEQASDWFAFTKSPVEWLPLTRDMLEPYEQLGSLSPPDRLRQWHELTIDYMEERMLVAQEFMDQWADSDLDPNQGRGQVLFLQIEHRHSSRLNELDRERIGALEKAGFSLRDYDELTKSIALSSNGSPPRWKEAKEDGFKTATRELLAKSKQRN